MSRSQIKCAWRHHLFLLLLLATGCQVAFTPYSNDGNAGLGGTGAAQGGNTSIGGGGGARTDANCSPEGTYRCTGTALELCSNHKWQKYKACSSDLCDASRGQCMSCNPGDTQCSAFRLQTCNVTGDTWVNTQECDTAQYCNSQTSACRTCLKGEAFCSGSYLYGCNDTEDGWVSIDCGSDDLCDARAQACQECPSKDWFACNGKELIGCDGAGHHVPIAECISSQVCQKSLNDRLSDPAHWVPSCSDSCTPRAFQCNPTNPAELRQCPPNGGDYEHVKVCQTAALCNAVKGDCDVGCGVPPGTYRCNGATLEQCNTDGTAFTTVAVCSKAEQCNTSQHTCVDCSPGTYQCSGAELQKCGADLHWTKEDTCASAELCNATQGVCIAPTCSPAGAYRCDGATLQVCASNLREWTDRDICFDAAHCFAGSSQCQPVSCTEVNEYKCQGNTRQICDATTHTWLVTDSCKSNEVCDLNLGCIPNDVCPALTRCNPVGTQADAQKCSTTDGTVKWTTVATCPSLGLCYANADGSVGCNAPACDVGKYSCDGQKLRKCKTDRTDWDLVKTCASGQICDATNGQCDVCVAKTFECNSLAQLTYCSDDGQNNWVADNCASVDCYTSSDRSVGYCYKCHTGDTQCSGSSQVQSCANDRRGWTGSTTCANGCVDSGASDYCAVCSVGGEVQCVQATSPGSTRTCSTDRKTWGATATCSKGYGCVDSGTADYCASDCAPSSKSCISAGASAISTSLFTCNADGKGGVTTSKCLDSSNLAACSNGALSSTKVACDSSKPYCVSGTCVECTGTTTICDGSGTLKTCSSGKWVTSSCSSDKPVCSGGACVACTGDSTATCPTTTSRRYCSNNAWTTSTCSGSTPYCEGGKCVACPSTTLATCSNDGLSVISCSDGNYVTTDCTGSKPVCYKAPGATSVASCSACNDATSPSCLSDGVTRQYCLNGAITSNSCAEGDTNYCVKGQCVGCTADSPAKCPKADTISTCSTDTGTYQDQKCPTDRPICDAPTGASAQCVECKSTTSWTCTSATTRQTCTNNKRVTDTCATGYACDATTGSCQPQVCIADQLLCAADGKTLQKCKTSLLGWDFLQTCAGACYGGACVTCLPGDTKCDASGTGLLTCLSDGSGWGAAKTECYDTASLKACLNGAWSGSQPCPDGSACDGGQCQAVICAAGDTRCNGNTPQVCNSSRTGWTSLAACSGVTPVCLSSGKCGCSSSLDCANVTDAPICGTEGKCIPQTCNDNDYVCAGSTLKQCKPDHSDWIEVASCSGGTPKCDAAAHACTCESSTTCAAATPSTPVCTNGKCVAATCGVGDARCDGNTSQICNARRDGWTDVTVCAGITPKCQAATGTCGCSADADCAGTNLTPLCSSTGTCSACSDTLPCPVGYTCQTDGSCALAG